MTENFSQRMPLDVTRINIFEQMELNWWTHQLNVSQSRLAEAVRAVGVSVESVKRYLGK